MDSVYEHVLAWQEALTAEGIELSVWRIHRKNRHERRALHEPTSARDENGHHRGPCRAPGALACRGLQEVQGENPAAPGRAATVGRSDGGADPLGYRHERPDGDRRPESRGTRRRSAVDAVVTRDDVKYAKPDPDLFVAAAEKLNVPITSSIVVGDSIWDMLAARRCQALGVGLLSGGYGLDELERAGAYRVYEDPADLLDHLD